jgi:hypothetical protein
VALSLSFIVHEQQRRKGAYHGMRHPFLCRPMTSTVKRSIKEHALIVRESMLPLVNQTALLWSGLLCSLFVHLRQVGENVSCA